MLDAAAPVIDKAAEMAPIDQRPDDETLIKLDAAVKIVAGSMLALNKFPRLASTALAASLVPTTLAGHRFWEETDEQQRAQQQVHFFKNVSLLGGLMIAAADTEGRPSLGWRGRRAARLAAAAVSTQAASLSESASDVTAKADRAPRPTSTDRLGLTAQDASGRLGSPGP